MAQRRTDERREPSFAQAARNSAARDKEAGEANRPRRAGKARGRARKGRSLLAAALYWTATLAVWAAICLAALITVYAAKLPPIDALAIPKRPPNIAILADNGALLANRGDTGGAAVRLAELPPYLPKAFVAIEDRRFYSHFGVDPMGILRAAARNVIGGGAVQGGSTLTQQLAKNLFLTQERTFSRKIQEAILALWLEHQYSKNQILELYLNRVYFGSGAYGVEAAAQKYFGHGARNVTLAEAAVLAGLMKAPTRLAPNRNPTGATERAAQVVAAMVQEGFITDAMGMLALSHPAETVHEQGAGSVNYAADYVMDVLDDTIGAIDEDIIVSTTLNQSLQAAAEKALAEELDLKGGKFGVGQGALVAMEPDGAIKALVGGRNYADSQFDRAVQAKRQPGSAFKPFVYLAALEKGLTPASMREDAPINVKGWQPENYGHEYLGPVTLEKALSQSLNTVAVRLGIEGRAEGDRQDRASARHCLGARAQRLDRARNERGYAARTRDRLCAIREWRHRRAGADHRESEDKRRQAALSAQGREQWPGDRSKPFGDDERYDAGNRAHRHGPQGRSARLAGGRQDRHQPGLARRLVHRLHEPSRDRRLARQ